MSDLCAEMLNTETSMAETSAATCDFTNRLLSALSKNLLPTSRN